MFETDEFKCPTFIPSSIWKDVNIFSGHLPNNIKKLLRDHFDILCFKLQFSVPYLNHFQNKLKLWLAYILSHPTLKIEQINHLSDKLKFNVHQKNVAASILGRWDLFDTTQNIEHSAKSELIEFFRIAYIHHHTDFILELFAQYPLLKPELIHHNHHEVLIHACHNGDVALIKLLLQQPRQNQLDMITSRNYLAFLEACRFGHAEIIQHLFSHAQEHVIPMIQAENYDGFFMACEQGFTDVLKLIAHHAPHEIPKILALSQYKALRLVVEKQYLRTFDFIIEQGQSCLIDMLSAKQYKPFQIACSKNNNELIYTLINLSEHAHCTKQMLSSQNFLNFNTLCANGNLELIKRYVSIFPKEIIELIQSENYAVFRIAAVNNQKQVIEYLLSLESVDTIAMLCSREFNSIIEFIQFGHIDFLGFLAEQYPSETHLMLLAHEFKLAKKAAQAGNSLLLKQVFQLLPPEIYPYIISSEQYNLFKYASSSNNVECLTFIIEKTPQLLHQMLTSNDYAAFRIADLYNQEKSIDFLLEFPQVFFYAEQHFQEYNLSVLPFINRKIDDIRNKLATQTEIHLNEQEAKIYFYIFRHFIRCYSPLPSEFVQLMLQVMQNVPRLREILADEVTPHAGENELLRFALSLRHNQAIEILLQHEIIRERAIEHHFYRLEIEEGIHLHVFVTDQESSMKALTSQESIRLNSALERYQPLLDQKTPKVILKQFIKQLEDKYQQNPAIYSLDSENPVKLPLQMTDFNQLDLTRHHQELALKQYFQHPIHTCWRFFQTPNLWMHPEAAYTLYNPINDTERWANYIDYIPLIATLYLAVTDEQFSACDGFTLESRLQHFINEIALLARAHNWDKTRIKIDEHGKPVLDNEGEVIHEAFDDNEGDRPSCYSGMKRRLFQSVLGHSLFKILTIDIVKMEIRDFIFQHVQASINADNIDSLSKAWKEWVEELNPESIACLKSLDINMEQQQIFIRYMNERYDKQFTDDPIFKQVIQDAFQLKHSHDAHLFKCNNVEQLLNPSKYKRTLPIEGFFSASEENTSPPTSTNKRSCL